MFVTNPRGPQGPTPTASTNQADAPAPTEVSQPKKRDGFESFIQGVSTTAKNFGNDVKNAAQPLGNLLSKDALNLLGPGSGSNSGWATRQGAPTTDGTATFNQLYSQTKSGQDVLPQDAKNYVYLSIDGLYGNDLPGYMKPNDDKLKSLGLNVQQVKIDTGASVQTNAQAIRDAILKASANGQQVVLVAHSKGGVDSTAALSLYPELKNDVRAVVTMQTPYGGTPIASDVEDTPGLSSLFNSTTKALLGATPASLQDLTYASRQQFVSQHPYPTDIPTVSMGSSRLSIESPLDATAEYMQARYGIASDGLVPAADAKIPGSTTVTLSNMNHADSTMNTPGDPWNAGDLTESLVAMALQTKPLT